MQALSSNAANGMKTAQRPRRDEWTTLCRGAFCERLGAGRKMRAQRFSGSLTAVTPHIMFVTRKTDAPACLQVLRCGGTETYDLTLHLHLGTRSGRAQLGLRRFVFLRKPQKPRMRILGAVIHLVRATPGNYVSACLWRNMGTFGYI